MRTPRTAALALSLSILVASTTALGAGSAAASVTKTVTTLAPGLTLTKITLSAGPVRIRVLTVDPKKAVMIDTTLAASTFGTYAPVNAMANANGAIAAINGDFGTWGPLRPVHSFSDDGALATTGSIDSAFAVSQDETKSHVAHVTVVESGLVSGSTTPFTVSAWNTGTPGSNNIDGYSPVGGTAAQPPSSGCFARLVSSGGLKWGPAQVGVSRVYTVNAMSCQSSRMALNGDVVLASKKSGTGATTIQSLTPGSSLTLTWALGTWPDVTTSIGGGPMLVAAGKVVAPTNCGYLCSMNPRTGVGVTKSGKILLVTVDGRNPGWSVGMTLTAFAKEMASLGAVNAMNLDGGGSSTMWTKKLGLVNRPTDCLPSLCERYVSSAVLVLPSSEKEPTITAGIHAAVTADPLASLRAAQLMLSDPGSTGGYMDALANGSLGLGGPLPGSYLRMAREFRASIHP